MNDLRLIYEHLMLEAFKCSRASYCFANADVYDTATSRLDEVMAYVLCALVNLRNSSSKPTTNPVLDGLIAKIQNDSISGWKSEQLDEILNELRTNKIIFLISLNFCIMKRIVIFIAILFVAHIGYAQTTSLTIDCQTPGWLQSYMNPADIQSVENLKVTGIINESDLVLIGNLVKNYSLQGKLDLSEVSIENNQLTSSMFGVKDCQLRYFALPNLSIENVATCLNWVTVDTLEAGGNVHTRFNYDYKSEYGVLKVAHLVLREGATNLRLSGTNLKSSPLKSIKLPESMKEIESIYYFTNLSEINIPNGIEKLGPNRYTNLYWNCDTLRLPPNLKYFDDLWAAMDGYNEPSERKQEFKGRIKCVYFPETIEDLCIDALHAGANVSVHFKSKTPPTKVRNGWFIKPTIVYVPKGCRPQYEGLKLYQEAIIIEESLLENIILDILSATMEMGETIRLIPTFIPSDADDKSLKWRVEDATVASVDENGIITALAPGKTKVYATSVATGVQDACEITVLQHVTDVTFETPDVILDGIGSTIQLNPVVTPEDATDKSVTWTSSNTSVCMVSNGKVVAVGYGSAVVVATSVDGGHMAVATITVREQAPEMVMLTIQQSENGAVSTSVEKGSTHTFIINAESGWKIHSVTFNDEDVTEQVDADGNFTTPAIMENSRLYVTFEEDVSTDVKAMKESAIYIQGTSFGIRVLHADGETAHIYTTDGKTIITAKVVGDSSEIELPEGNTFIVKVADKILKVIR